MKRMPSLLCALLLSLPVFAATPPIQITADVQNPVLFDFTTYQGNTPVIIANILTNGGAYALLGSGWTPQLNYSKNEYASYIKTITGTVDVATGVATFTCVTNTFPASGDWMGEVYLYNGGQKITCAQGVIRVKKSPSSGSVGSLNLMNVINWDIVTNIGSFPWSNFDTNYLGAQITANLNSQNATSAVFQALFDAQKNTNSGFQASITNLNGFTNYTYTAWTWGDWETNGLATTNQLYIVSNLLVTAQSDITNNLANQALTNAVFQALHTAQGNTNAGFESRLVTVETGKMSLATQTSTNTSLQNQIAANLTNQNATNASFQTQMNGIGTGTWSLALLTDGSRPGNYLNIANTNYLGGELVTNGNFTGSASNWSLTAFYYNGNRVILNPSLAGQIEYTNTLTVATNKLYQLTVKTTYAGAAVTASVGGVSYAWTSADGNTHKEFFHAVSDAKPIISASTGTNSLELDDVTLKECPTGSLFVAQDVNAGNSVYARVGVYAPNVTYLSGGIMTGPLTNNVGFYGNGSGLTNIPSSGSGFPLTNNNNLAGFALTNGSFIGNGSGLTNLTVSITNNLIAATNNLNSRMSGVEGNTGKWETAYIDSSSATNDIVGLKASTNALNTRATSIEASTGSLNTATNALQSQVITLQTSTNAINAEVTNHTAQISDLQTATGLLFTATNTLNTLAINTSGLVTNILYAATNALNTRVANTEISTGTLNTAVGNLNTATNNINGRLAVTETNALLLTGTRAMQGNMNIGGYAVSNLSLTTYTNAGAVPLWISDTDGRLWPTDHKIEIANRTIAVATNESLIDAINGIGKYIPGGVTITVQPAAGTHTLTSQVDLVNFSGAGMLKLESATPVTGASRTQTVSFVGTTLTSSKMLYINNNTPFISVKYIAFQHVTNASFGAITAENNPGAITIEGNWIHHASAEAGIQSITANVRSRYNMLDNNYRAFRANTGSIMTSSGDEGTNNITSAYNANGGFMIKGYLSAVEGPTNCTFGALILTGNPNGTILP